MTGVVKKGKAIRLLLTGGGTGGHLFPAIATAQKLMETAPESVVQFVGTKRKMDKTSLEKYNFSTRSIHSYGLKGKSIPELIKALLVMPFSCIESIWILLRFKPDVVLGVGGYVTGPVVAMAKLFRVPTLIHEQNSVPGLANRKLGALVDKVCISIPDSGAKFPDEKVVFTGNPVRKEILLSAQYKKKGQDEFVILVLGGSQGAHGVNILMTEAMGKLIGIQGKPVKVIHQTGANDQQLVKDSYQKYSIESEVEPFFQDMASLYEAADLVVSRAGATTLSELAVMGKPALLIPYPTAADNHQRINADYYANLGGAIVLEERQTDAKELAENIRMLYEDPQKLDEMAGAMLSLGVPEAPERIVETCYSLLKEK